MRVIKGLATFTKITSFMYEDDKIEIIGLANLTVLDLYDCGISRITGLETLTTLIDLNLGHNFLDGITGLETLTNLINLNLSSNAISEIKGLKTLTKLTNLNLSYNEIKITGESELLPNLTSLNLSNNDMFEFFLHRSLPKLTDLNLRNCHLQSVVFMENYFPKLEKLDLGFNKLVIIEGLDELKKLKLVGFEFGFYAKEIKSKESFSKLLHESVRKTVRIVFNTSSDNVKTFENLKNYMYRNPGIIVKF